MEAYMNRVTYNEKVDITLHQCKKSKANSKKLCKWSGSLGDYITHVKTDHNESYFAIDPANSTFEWTLDTKHDQVDKGILSHKLGYFLYIFYYCNTSGEVLFGLTCLYKHQGFTEQHYSLEFYKKQDTDLVGGDIKMIPCDENDLQVVIEPSVLANFVNYKGAIKFKISIS